MDSPGHVVQHPHVPEETPLFEACRSGHLSDLHDLIDSHADVRQVDSEGRTALYVATCAGHSHIVRWLLSLPEMDVNARTRHGTTALMVACAYGSPDLVRIFLNHGASVNLVDHGGRGPLSMACYHGYRSIIFLLLKHPGTEVNLYAGHTPLHWAVMGGNVKVVQFLIQEAEALNLNVLSAQGNSALHLACSQGLEDIALELLRSGADFNCINNDGETPLHVACKFNRGSIAEALLAHLAEVNVEDVEGVSPLHVAIENTSIQCILPLLRHPETDLNKTDQHGRTALLLACERGFQDIACDLLRFGANVNTPDRRGDTPLLRATKNESYDLVSILLESPYTRMNIRDYQMRTALTIACERSQLQVAKLLIQRGADVNLADDRNRTPLFWMSLHDHRDIVKQILKVHDCQVDVVSDTGTTALHVACLHGNQEVVQRLIKYHADVNWVNPKSRTTVLHVAIYNGQVEMAKMLAKLIGNLNAQDFDGCTALYLACDKGFGAMVKVLLKLGADGNIATFEGRTPLVAACCGAHEDMVKRLLRSGVRVNEADGEGRTALHHAVINGMTSSVRRLLKRDADIGLRDESDKTPVTLAYEYNQQRVVHLLLAEGIARRRFP